MKLACRSLTSAWPITRVLQAGLVDQHAGAHAARILEDAAGALMSQRLAGLLDDPLLLHPLGQLGGIVLLELELRAQDHQLVERAFAIGKHQLLARALEDLAARASSRWPGRSTGRCRRRGCRRCRAARRRSCRECRPGFPVRPGPRAPRSRWHGPAWRRRRPRRFACPTVISRKTPPPKVARPCRSRLRRAPGYSNRRPARAPAPGPRRSAAPALAIRRRWSARRSTRPGRPGETRCAARAAQPALRIVRNPCPSSCAIVPMSPAPSVTSTSPAWSERCK